MNDQLSQQVNFLMEIDKLKGISRQTVLVDGSRHENSAEHSWHVSVCASVLAPYASEGVELGRVLQMLLVHDIVEIDAGDTFAYDSTGRASQRDRELEASRRLFALLPEAQAAPMAQLWSEFDAMQTADARYAHAVDRFMPLLHNYYTAGKSWREHGVSRSQVLERMACIQEGMPALWPYVTWLLDDAVRKGYLAP